MAKLVLGTLVPVGGGDPVALTEHALSIGRRESSDLCLSYPNVSSSHCRLFFQNSCWYIEDLRSSNGTKVNGERITPANPKLLRPGDEVSIAKHAYTIDYVPPSDMEALQAQEVDDIFSQSLMEKAGLERAKPKKRD